MKIREFYTLKHTLPFAKAIKQNLKVLSIFYIRSWKRLLNRFSRLLWSPLSQITQPLYAMVKIVEAAGVPYLRSEPGAESSCSVVVPSAVKTAVLCSLWSIWLSKICCHSKMPKDDGDLQSQANSPVFGTGFVHNWFSLYCILSWEKTATI